jgi:hypothetical protein
MAGGVRVPILDTDRARGTYRFRVARGGHYGRRRLHVTVKHGYASRQAMNVDTYRVRPPRPLAAPKRLSAHRYDHNVLVRWSGVRGARGYIVQVANAERGKPVGLVRRVSARSRSTIFRATPGAGRLIARVHALNVDDELGRARAATFESGPSARTLREAARRSARSAERGTRSVTVVTHCPDGAGHCQVVVELRKRGRLLGRTRLQQAPNTLHLHRIRPDSRRLQQLMRQGRDPGIYVIVKLRHGIGSIPTAGRSDQAQARARVRR